MSKKYEVQTFTLCDGWINNWWDVDTGEPEYFNSHQEADKCLREDIKDWNLNCDEGCEDSLDNYRIMEVKNKKEKK